MGRCANLQDYAASVNACLAWPVDRRLGVGILIGVVATHIRIAQIVREDEEQCGLACGLLRLVWSWHPRAHRPEKPNRIAKTERSGTSQFTIGE